MFRFIAAVALAVVMVIHAPLTVSAAPGPDGSVGAVLSAINAERANAGLGPIALDGGGTAQGAADEYMNTGTAHGPGNSWTMSGDWHSREIAASVSGTTGEAVSLWMGSAGHRRAILDDSAESVRVGVACREDDGRMFVVAQIRVRHGSGAAEPNGSVTSPTSGPKCNRPAPTPTPTPTPTQPAPTPAPTQPGPTQPRPTQPGSTSSTTTSTTAPTTTSSTTSSTAPESTTSTPDSTTTPEDLPPLEGPEGGAAPPSDPTAPSSDGQVTINEASEGGSTNMVYLVIAAVALLGAIAGVVLLYRYGTSRSVPSDDYDYDDYDDDGSAAYDGDASWGPSTP